MAIVLQRLERVLKNQSSTTGNHDSLVSYINAPEKRNEGSEKAIFTLLIEEDASLELEYNTLRILLQNALKAWNAEIDILKKQVLQGDAIRLVREALHLSTLLDRKYCRYINDRPTLRKATLENHQVLYRRWLHVHVDDLLLYSCHNRPKVDMPYADEIRAFFERTNRYRLGALRARRLFLVLIPILNNFERYGSSILWLDYFIAPLLSYINLLFFLPRLTLNAYTLGSHWIEHALMSPEEKSLGATFRFNAQWDRLWPNITNDMAWAANAALTFFVFTGSLQPYGIYFGLGLQLYDLLSTSLRGYHEACRLKALEQQYWQLHESNPHDAQITAYLLLLQKQIHRTQDLLLLSMTNFVVLFLVAVLALPSIATLSPWMPVVGALMSVIMTGFNFWGRDYLMLTGAHELDGMLNCDVPERDLMMRRNLSSLNGSCLFFDQSGFTPIRKCSSSPQLNASPVTVSTTLSHGLFPLTAPPRKGQILTNASQDNFFFSDIDGNPSTSVRL